MAGISVCSRWDGRMQQDDGTGKQAIDMLLVRAWGGISTPTLHVYVLHARVCVQLCMHASPPTGRKQAQHWTPHHAQVCVQLCMHVSYLLKRLMIREFLFLACRRRAANSSSSDLATPPSVGVCRVAPAPSQQMGR